MKTKFPRVITIAAALAAAASARAQQGPPAPRGLDGLDEKEVYVNLIKYKLTDLAKVDMEAHKVPAAEQQQMFDLADLAMLKSDNNLSAAQRRALAVKAANGLNAILAKTTDIDTLNDDANDLVNYGVQPMVDDLDYFGDNPEAQKQLQPAAQTAKDFYTKASTLIDNQLNALQNQMNNANMNAIRAKAQVLVNKQTIIDYTNNMTGYALAISYPPGNPKRTEAADAAIAFLKNFDNKDSGVQPEIKITIGKLNLAKGDFKAAHDNFEPVIAGTGAVTPAPTVTQQNTARFFSVVADLDAKEYPKAETDETALEDWQKINLHTAGPGAIDAGTLNGIAASMGMLKFRIFSAESDAAGANTAAGKKFNDKAITALVKLLGDQPGNRTLADQVFGQIRGRIGENPDYKQLDTLALLALQSAGLDEFYSYKTKPVEPPVMEKAIAASRELVARKGQPGIDQAKAEQSAFFVPMAYDLALHNDVEAVKGYLDYLTDFKANPKTSEDAGEALNNCEAILGEMKKKQDAKQTTAAEDDVINGLFDRFFPLVLAPPYDQKQLAYLYGKSLYAKKKWTEAAKYLALVEPTNPSLPTATFMRMVALDYSLSDANAPVPADQRKAVAADTIETADKVQKQSLEAAKGKDVSADNRKLYLGRVIAASQVAAGLARSELKDQAMALKEIDGIEDKASGLDDPEKQKAIHISALSMRCQIYLDTGDTAKAVQTDLDLLNTDPAAGQQMLFDVNQAVEHDLNAAMAAKDKDAIKKLSVQKADLTGQIVVAIQNSPVPAIRAQLPAYQLYDAQSKQTLAELLDPGPQQTAALNGAMDQYNALLKQYKDSGEAAKLAAVTAQIAGFKDPSKIPPDLLSQQKTLKDNSVRNAQAALGAGMVSFDLGDFQKTVDLLSPLVKSNQAGAPTGPGPDGKEVEDPRYWEVFYKFYQACVNVAEKNKDAKSAELLAEAKKQLVGAYSQFPTKLGGTLWHEQCMNLVRQLKIAK